MHYKFVDKTPGGNLKQRMLKGGLIVWAATQDDAHTAAEADDEVWVIINDNEEWADEDAWVRAIEAHYSCVFDDAAE